jgi:enamine deaminase RidA (YjgF/YER057c/UK114 family)
MFGRGQSAYMDSIAERSSTMQRIAINPVDWSLQYGYNQGELVEGHRRTLYCAGQIATDAEMTLPDPDDMRGQMVMALDNLEQVLEEAAMSLADVVDLTIYTTDMPAAFAEFDAIVERLEKADVRPAQSFLGVAALAQPELKVEIKATAVQ